MNKRLKSGFTLIFVFVLIITGCGVKVKKNPQEILGDALEKSFEAKSYEFHTSFGIDDLQVMPAKKPDENTQKRFSMLKGAKFHANGVVQLQPLQIEATYEVELAGDMEIKFSIPFVYKEDKVWIKFPNIPIYPMPSDLVGKFIEINMKKLFEKEGEKLPEFAELQQLLGRLCKTLKGKFDENTYFTTIDKKSASIPENVNADQIVKIHVTNESLEPLITAFVKKVLPEIIAILEEEKNRKLLNLKSKEIEKLKQFQKSDSELKAFLKQLKKELQINELSVTTAINKDSYPTYQKCVVNLETTEENGDKTKSAEHLNIELSKINEKADFKIGIPTNTVPFEKLERYFK